MASRIPFAAAATIAVSVVLGACSGSSPNRQTALTAAGPSASVAPLARTITATGDGRASGTPDLLTVTIGVQTTGATAREVLTTNSTEAAALIAKLEADGVQTKDIQTAQLSLSPVYADPSPNQPPRLTGYTATDTVSVRIRHLDKAGAILDDAAAAGGSDTQIQSVGYSVEDTGALLVSAHADAVSRAEAEAKAMAAAAGVALGPLRAVTDASQPQVVPYAPSMGAASAAAPSLVAVPVQPGTEEVTAEVTVSYDVG